DSLDPLILCFGAERRSPPVIALNTQQSTSIFVLERVVGADDGDGLHPTPIQPATGRYGRAAPRPEAMDQSPALPIRRNCTTLAAKTGSGHGIVTRGTPPPFG